MASSDPLASRNSTPLLSPIDLGFKLQHILFLWFQLKRSIQSLLNELTDALENSAKIYTNNKALGQRVVNPDGSLGEYLTFQLDDCLNLATNTTPTRNCSIPSFNLAVAWRSFVLSWNLRIALVFIRSTLETSWWVSWEVTLRYSLLSTGPDWIEFQNRSLVWHTWCQCLWVYLQTGGDLCHLHDLQPPWDHQWINWYFFKFITEFDFFWIEKSSLIKTIIILDKEEEELKDVHLKQDVPLYSFKQVCFNPSIHLLDFECWSSRRRVS